MSVCPARPDALLRIASVPVGGALQRLLQCIWRWVNELEGSRYRLNYTSIARIAAALRWKGRLDRRFYLG
jgi:hypothetical protein